MFQILADECTTIGPIVKLVKYIIRIIQIGIPILLILMGSIDLGKAVISSDDKEIKGAVGKLVKRAIAAIAVFFVATLVRLIMGWIADSNEDDSTDTESWWNCWTSV